MSVEDEALLIRSPRAVIDEVSSRYADIPGAAVDHLIALRRSDASRA